METIEFFKNKVDEIILQIATYNLKEQTDGLDVWEEVANDELKRELEHYTSAISSLKALHNFLRPKAKTA